MKVIGQLILVEGTNDNNIIELEDAVEEGVDAYMRKFPESDDLLVYISEKTRSRWAVNGSISGLEAYRDDDIPYPYVWIINARDKQSFSPKRIN
jgi:hypothetical protein